MLANPVQSGVYTPSLDFITNLDGASAHPCQWMRVGNVVTVSGYVDVDPTAGASTRLDISLPVPTTFGGADDECGGVAFARAVAGQGAAILGFTTNTKASMIWVAVDTASRAMYFTFAYKVSG